MRAILLILTLILPAALAGCLSGEEDAPSTEPVDAGAVGNVSSTTAAPSGPTQPYEVPPEAAPPGEAKPTIAHPVRLPTNGPKEPVTLSFEGEMTSADCTPTGTTLPIGFVTEAQNWRYEEFGDALAKGDVFSYAIEARFNNSEDSWGELHLYYGIGATREEWSEPTGETRGEVVMTFQGQGYRQDDAHDAWVLLGCWYGNIHPSKPIAYTLTVTLTFAADAVPAQAPILLTVPPDAHNLVVRGVPLDASKGVLSHFRLFRPDDTLLCECALSSNKPAVLQPLEGPGEYVLLVDHTDNGFVSVALDVPPSRELVPLGLESAATVLLEGDGGPVDATVTFDLPRTPLSLGTWVLPPGGWASDTPDAGTGRAYAITLTNARGTVIENKMGGWVTYRIGVPGAFWMGQWIPVPYPDVEWSFVTDHHAYDLGAHTATLKAEAFRGEVELYATYYARP